MLYPPPIQCQNYSSGHKSETDQPNQKTAFFNYIFLHLGKHLWLKIQNTNGQKSSVNFFDVQNLHIMAH